MSRGDEKAALRRARALKPTDRVLVEVNEPGLGMDLVPGSGERFADALVARVPA